MSSREEILIYGDDGVMVANGDGGDDGGGDDGVGGGDGGGGVYAFPYPLMLP